MAEIIFGDLVVVIHEPAIAICDGMGIVGRRAQLVGVPRQINIERGDRVESLVDREEVDEAVVFEDESMGGLSCRRGVEPVELEKQVRIPSPCPVPRRVPRDEVTTKMGADVRCTFFQRKPLVA